jgi:tetratricopeptide (TPR) repeat protein
MFKGLFGSHSQRHYARGIEHFNEGLLDEAISCFEEAIGGDADGPEAALARFYRAEAHARLGARSLEAGDPADALAHFDAALEEHTRYPDLHIQRSIALLHTGDALAAEQAARAALDLNEEFVDAGAALVVALRQQGDVGRARDAVSHWAKLATQKGDPLAVQFCTEDGLFEALVAYRRRRMERRRIVEHAESCLRDGFWSEAARSLEPLVQETPDYPDLRLRLAAARLGLGELESASSQLEAALASNPDFADAHVLTGIVRLRLDQVRSARVHFDIAAESGRVPVVALYGLVLCDLREGALVDALAGMNRLAGEDAPPEDAKVLHAILEALAGRVETAVERCEALLTESRRTDLLLDILVWATEGTHLDLAHRALARIEDGDRTRVDVVRAHARLRRREGAIDRARQLCESALMDHPVDVGLLRDLAALCAEQGDGAAGLRCMDALPEDTRDASRDRGLRAKLLRIEGRGDDARELLEATLAADSPAEALEQLYLCRAADLGDQARSLYEGRADESPLALAWRVQDPERWLGPLRPWPAGVASAYPAT